MTFFFRWTTRFGILILSGMSGGLLQASGLPWNAPHALRFNETRSEGIQEGDDGRKFLAIDPPNPLSEAERGTILESLPLRGPQLLDPHSDFSILAIGDSVTATGPFPEILARLLERKTGRAAGTISVRRSAYPGKSVDAAIRNWRHDSENPHADLILIMFGLNDQAAGSSLDAYIQQMEWLVRRAKEQGSDIMLMEPTPHIDIIAKKESDAAKASIFRTITFAGALQEVAGHPPIVPSFSAIWRNDPGSPDLQAAARAMWPFFPKHYQNPFSNLTEDNGKGDFIHPNAAGHLLLARSVFDRILQNDPNKSSLDLSASTRWQNGQMISSLVATNIGDQRRTGEIHVYPYPSDDQHQVFPYDLGLGESCTFEFIWPDIKKPEDVLSWPTSRVFLQGIPWVQIMDIHINSASSYQVQVRALPAEILPSRRWKVAEEQSMVSVEKPFASILQCLPGEARIVQVPLQKNLQKQRIPLFEYGKGSVRELVAVRMAAAMSGETWVDGSLDEWSNEETSWMKLTQEAMVSGTGSDEGEVLQDLQVRWALRVGDKGIWGAFVTTGASINGDEFTLLFDAESSKAEKIGQAAPYTWVSGRLEKNGKLVLQAGDSSQRSGDETLQGRWHHATDGDVTTGELFIPYETMNVLDWPESGYMGLSLVWIHKVSPEKRVQLNWSADRFPWNTLGFGIVCRDPTGKLPWKVRLR